MACTKEEIQVQAYSNLNKFVRIAEATGFNPWKSAAQAATSTKSQIMKFQSLKDITSKISQIGSQLTACSSSCNYCCYQSVSVCELEASAISKLTGRSYTRPKNTSVYEDRQKYMGVPCTFLDKGRCSIYEERPIICRTHLNLSNVNEICKVGNNLSSNVPYLDTSPLLSAIGLICGVEYHDIRDWFPKEKS